MNTLDCQECLVQEQRFGDDSTLVPGARKWRGRLMYLEVPTLSENENVCM